MKNMITCYLHDLQYFYCALVASDETKMLCLKLVFKMGLKKHENISEAGILSSQGHKLRVYSEVTRSDYCILRSRDQITVF